MNRWKVKKAIAISGILFCVWGFTGCAETPEEQKVVDRSGGISEENIIPEEKDTPKDLGVPEHWKETIEKSEGFVTLEADYKLEIPEIYNTPVYSYEMEVMTEERLKELCDYFSEGNKLYEYPKMTKSQLDAEKEKMVNFQGRWASWKDLAETSYWKEKIALLDEMIESAPDEQGKYQYMNEKFGEPYQTEQEYFNGLSDYYYDTDKKLGLTARVDKGMEVDPVIRAINYDESVGSITRFLYRQGTFLDEADLSELSYENQDQPKEYELWFDSLQEEISGSSPFSREEALQKVDEILKDLSIEGFQVSQCVKAIGSRNTESWMLLDDKNGEKSMGYSIHLYRKAGDVMGYSQLSPMIYENVPEVVYAPSFSTEKICITVTQEGIEQFEWTSISDKVDTIAENTKLLSFGDIKEKLANHLLYGAMYDEGDKFKDEGNRHQYTIKSVQLRAANINAYNEPEKIWLVPVWVFDMEDTAITADGKELKWGIETVVLNAIDGGYIQL